MCCKCVCDIFDNMLVIVVLSRSCFGDGLVMRWGCLGDVPAMFWLGVGDVLVVKRCVGC